MILGTFKHEVIIDHAALHLLHSINSKLNKIMEGTEQVLANEQEILAEIETLKVKEATLQTTLDSVQQTLVETLAAKDVTIATAQTANETLKATILELQGQVGSGMSPAGVQSLRESLGLIAQGLDVITADAASTFPTTPNAPAPEPVTAVV